MVTHIHRIVKKENQPILFAIQFQPQIKVDKNVIKINIKELQEETTQIKAVREI